MDRRHRHRHRTDHAGLRAIGAAAQPPRRGDRAQAKHEDHDARRQERGRALPGLERREQVQHERRVVEPVRIETAAVHHLPRARHDRLLVRIEQGAEREAVLDADGAQGCCRGKDHPEDREAGAGRGGGAGARGG